MVSGLFRCEKGSDYVIEERAKCCPQFFWDYVVAIIESKIGRSCILSCDQELPSMTDSSTLHQAQTSYQIFTSYS